MIFLDFETQSLADIKNSRKYVADPSTRVVFLAFITDKKYLYSPISFQSPEDWTLLKEMPELNDTLIAHNAMTFDKPIWDRFVKQSLPWKDTIYFCRAAGLPGSLEKVSQILFNEGKDPNGKKFIDTLCKARVKNGEIEYPMALDTAWSAFAKYCCKDVELLEKLYSVVAPYEESDVIQVHDIINERGIPIDIPLAARICLLQEELAFKNANRFSEISGLGPNDIRSTKKVITWLEGLGVKLPQKNGKPTLDKKELFRFFEENEGEDSVVVEALKARLEVTRTTKGKALAMLKAVDEDDRIRGQHVYWGAHTGRWSGREIQPHNFPRSKTNLALCEDKISVNDLGPNPAETLSGLLRPIISAPNISIADYSSIEARGVAWVSNDSSLEDFRHPDADPYLPLASEIFGKVITKENELERWVGKQAILGAGYGMSWMKFDLYCKVQGIDLTKIGLDPKHIINTYRKSHQAIVQSWKALHESTFLALSGKEIDVCKCRLYMNDNNLTLRLPSHRRIIYRRARVEMRKPTYFDREVPTVVYDHPHGYVRILYGGRMMENIVQAVCRDILAESLVRVEKANLKPFMHVHDEIVGENDDIKEQLILMSKNPEWAPNLPILVEGFSSNRYHKRSGDIKALNGVLV